MSVEKHVFGLVCDYVVHWASDLSLKFSEERCSQPESKSTNTAPGFEATTS